MTNEPEREREREAGPPDQNVSAYDKAAVR